VMKNKFLPKYPGPSSSRKFSYFEELFKKPELRDWVLNTPANEDLFVDWVGKERIDQGTHVRELPAILDDPAAVAALTKDGFAAAQRVIEEDNPTLTSKLFKRMAEMTDALKKAQLDDIQRVRKASNSRARRIVEDLDDSLRHFIELCDITR
jgi:hypothetical protein